ncbi:MAG: TonB-dependent siderophore receptor [Comamonadaceae bacterium PBBC2]|nr:MAG: TonB-dependent siderophore receptor [Comamonadaceae bacterium PBBC2]
MAFFSPVSRRSQDRFVFRASRLASAVALLTAGWAQAQSANEITITDTAPSQVSGFGDVPLSKAPYSAISFDRQVLQDIGAQRVSDALRLDASVADSYNSPAYWDSLSVRGYTLDNRYNYRREGLPISAETMIGMDNKERIELFKGTSGIQAGTSAPGGLVNYVVKRAPSGNDEVIRSVSASYGPGQSSSVALDLGGRLGETKEFGYRFNAAYEDLNPYIRNTQGHRNLIALAMDWRISADSKLEWEIEKSERQQMGVNGYSLLGNQLPAPVDGKTNLTRQSWSVPGVFAGTTGSVRFKQSLGDGWLWTTSYGAQRLKTDDRLTFAMGHNCYGSDVNAPALCDRYSADGKFDLYDFRSDNERRKIDAVKTEISGSSAWGNTKHDFSASIMRFRQLDRLPPLQAYNLVGEGSTGGGFTTDSDPTLSYPNVNRSEYSTELALSDRITLPTATTVWMGVRHTQYKRQSSENAICDDNYVCTPAPGTNPTTANGHVTTPWLAVSQQLSPELLAYASYGQGVELGVTPNKPSYTNAGQALPALRSKQFELGIKHHTASTRWQATVFDITRPQSADACDVNGEVCTRQIDGQAHHRGLELSGGLTHGQWNGDVNAAWIDAKRQNAEIDPTINGQTALNVPRMTLRALAQYRFTAVPGLRSSLRVDHCGLRHALRHANRGHPHTVDAGHRQLGRPPLLA